MEQYAGKSIMNGIAIGRILYYEKKQQKITREQVEDTEREIIRYEMAKEQAIEQLQQLRELSMEEAGQENAMIFDGHMMLLQDDMYHDFVYQLIRAEAVNAEYAVTMAEKHFAEMFLKMEDEYLKARAEDIKDISNRILQTLNGENSTVEWPDEPVIVVVEELTPSETIQMDEGRVMAFVTRLGSANSHTAILARCMNIPTIAGVDVKKQWDGKMAIVDGRKGFICIEPDEAALEMYMKQLQSKEESMVQIKEKQIPIYANIQSEADVKLALENGAAGIGLLRSEYLYLKKDDYPTEEELFQEYKSIVEAMEGAKVVIRTLDMGADKKIEYFNLEPEENPAMGYRGIRICLQRIELFKTQLRAIYRAAAYGRVSVMFPMIISVDEVRKVKQICEEVRKELANAQIGYGDVELGIMIETPAAVMISDLLAGEVEFFSIGTNDLTQFTLAVDRQNTKLDGSYDSHHPAILRMIRMVVEHGHANGCWVGICGELAADPALMETFVDMGVDELSVSPHMIYKCK